MDYRSNVYNNFPYLSMSVLFEVFFLKRTTATTATAMIDFASTFTNKRNNNANNNVTIPRHHTYEMLNRCTAAYNGTCVGCYLCRVEQASMRTSIVLPAHSVKKCGLRRHTLNQHLVNRYEAYLLHQMRHSLTAYTKPGTCTGGSTWKRVRS